MPRRLGQHFLADRRYQQRIVDAMRLRGDELVVEIGAGRGAITSLLAERARLVLAIELDAPLAAFLREKFATEPRVRVIEGDVLKLPLAFLPAQFGFDKARAAGNLPYYITSPILMRLFESSSAFDEITVMVQLEVAERVAAAPGGRDYGLLSVTAQCYTRPEIVFRIPPRAFRPPPKVSSALLRMPVAPRREELGIGDERAFFAFVRAAFQQKRKTLVNNLKALYGTEAVTRALEHLGLPPAARAETLSVAQFARLFSMLSRRSP